MKAKELTVYQTNNLIHARYDFSVVEKRCMAKIIHSVRKNFVEQEGQRDLFDDLVVSFPISELTDIHPKTRTVYNSLIGLMKRVVELEDEHEWKAVGLVSVVKHKKDDKMIELTVDKEILPEFVNLAENFTSTQLQVYMALSSQYSQRLYEYCSRWKNNRKADGKAYFTMRVDDLKDRLMIADKYARYALFKKYVLDKAMNDLKELYEKGECDLFFEYTENHSKTRKSTIESINFAITTRKNDVLGEMKPMDYMYLIKQWLLIWFEADKKPKNKQWVEKVMNHLTLNAELLKPCYVRLMKLQEDKPREDWAPLARYIITEDFME